MDELGLLEGQEMWHPKRAHRESVCCVACPYCLMEIMFNSKITVTKILLILMMS